MPQDSLRECRKLFPVTARYAYLNNAGVAPLSLPVRDAVHRWVDDALHHGLHHESGWEDATARVRAQAARLVGAEPHEIAFVRNTSHGLSLVAEGIAWRTGDEVAICSELEYPSNIYPWLHLRNRGVVVRPVPPERGGVTPEALASALTDRTRLVSVSAVQFATGHRTDLAAVGALCAERNLLLCVDGIQQLGAFELDVKRLGIHFLSADSHKWLLGVCGIGVLFVDRTVVDELRPSLVGWKSTTDPWCFERPCFDLRRDAQKFEEGTPAYALVYGLGAALELLEHLTLPAVEDHIRGLLTYLEQQARLCGWRVRPEPDDRAGILIVEPPGDPRARVAACASAGVSVAVRSGGVRVSPHAYNNRDDIDRLVSVLRSA